MTENLPPSMFDLRRELSSFSSEKIIMVYFIASGLLAHFTGREKYYSEDLTLGDWQTQSQASVVRSVANAVLSNRLTDGYINPKKAERIRAHNKIARLH